jgi:tetratricopeptide (TPR) repeat protein
MTKKLSEKVKLSSSKLNKKEVLTKSTARILQMAQKTPAKKSVGDDPRFAQAVQNYEAGLRALQEHKFEKAKASLQKVIAGGNKELADRAAVHLSACNQHLDRVTNQFKSPEEHYDYAISLMNVGDYVMAREHLEKLSKQVPKADYVAYGLAALDCLTGHVEDSLRHLDNAIRLNPALRFQARNDSDFQNLAEDPRFTELLYPDPGAELGSIAASSEEDELQ